MPAEAWDEYAERILEAAEQQFALMARTYVEGQLERARQTGMDIAGDTDMIADLLVRVAHSILVGPDSMIYRDETRMTNFARQVLLPLLRAT